MSAPARRTALASMAAGCASIALIAPLTAGCASLVAAQTRAFTLARSRGELTGDAVDLDDVAFFPQTSHHCGPAALATVLARQGYAVHPDDLARAVLLPAREGSLQVEMFAAPRRVGAVATRVPGRLTSLWDELQAGHPVVVLQNLGLDWQPLWHYAVLVGIDPDRAEVVMRSGTTRRETMALATFELTWARSGHWAFVVTRPGAWPATSTREQAEEAAIGFERSAASSEAARVYASMRARWPDSLVATMGLGNTKLVLGDNVAAAAAFERAAQCNDSAAAWNNLAVARARSGDVGGAAMAVQRALVRAQTVEPALLDAVRDTQARLQRGEVP